MSEPMTVIHWMLRSTDAAREYSKLQSRLTPTSHRKVFINTGMVKSLTNRWQKSVKDHSHLHETVDIFIMKKLIWHSNVACQTVGQKAALHKSYQERPNRETLVELCHRICTSSSPIYMPNLAVLTVLVVKALHLLEEWSKLITNQINLS